MIVTNARPIIFWLFALAAASRCLAETPGAIATLVGDNETIITIAAEGRERRCLLYRPPDDNGSAVRPLVLFFHGAGGSAESAARLYGWEQKADREHFIVAFPEALPAQLNRPASFSSNPRFWRDGRPDLLNPNGINDVGFVSDLLDNLTARFFVDQHRIYAVGFSSGGDMTFTLGVALSGRLAAIAPVASHLFVPNPTLARPVSLFYLIGNADPLNPLAGGDVRSPWGGTKHEPPVAQSIETWRRLLDCPAEPTVVRDSGGVKELRYGPGKEDSEVLFCTVENMGHSWPGAPEPLPSSLVGQPSNKINATDTIWKFFAEHALP
jgi:polyhydroxybutyrate depolymerase